MKVPGWLLAAACGVSFTTGWMCAKASIQIAEASSSLHPSEDEFDEDAPAPGRHQRANNGAAIINGDSDGVGRTAATTNDHKLRWELNMRRARSYTGISVPDYNGYSAKCIPDSVMRDMGAEYDKTKLKRDKMGLMDGLRHEVTPSVNQVGEFAFENMKYEEDG